MTYDLKTLFLLFMFYSFVGWIIEEIDQSISQKKIVNRGFLIGPYCPVYGIGAVLMIIFLKKYENDIAVLFVMGFVICGVLEYITSYLMEKIFKARWWDYSNYRFNLNGRICLLNLILFGLGCVILLHLANPMVIRFINKMPSILTLILSIILCILLVTDISISFKIVLEFKNLATNIRKDSTNEIKKMMMNALETKSILYRRLPHAFPNIQLKIKDEFKKKIKKVEN